MIHILTTFCILAVSVVAFAPGKQPTVTSLQGVRSKSVPFIEQPPALTGKLPGDVGFDPLGLSSLWADVRNFVISRLFCKFYLNF